MSAFFAEGFVVHQCHVGIVFEGVGIDAAGRPDDDHADARLLPLDDRLCLTIMIGLFGAHGPVAAVVHAEAGRDHGGMKAQHIVFHPPGEARAVSPPQPNCVVRRLGAG